MTRPFTTPLPPAGGLPREVATVVNKCLEGKTNNIGQLTLGTSTSATVFQDARLTKDSFIRFDPLTDNAAAVTPYVRLTERSSGSHLVRHSNVAAADVSYLVLIIG